MNQKTNDQLIAQSQYHLEKSRRATQLINDPLLKEVLQARKEQLFQEFCSTEAGDVDKREKIWRQVQESFEFETYLNTLEQVGSVAKEEIRHLTNQTDII